MSLNKLTACALFTAIIAILAQIAVPLPFSPVPFTGQLIGLLAAGIMLGPKAGFLAIFAYLLLGAAGVPVFSMARGGIYMLLGPTGGYLWGFIPAVLLTGALFERFKNLNIFFSSAALLPALLVVYLCGTLQLSILMQHSIKEAALIGVLPFIPFDLLKIIMTAYLSLKIKASMRVGGLGHLFN